MSSSTSESPAPAAPDAPASARSGRGFSPLAWATAFAVFSMAAALAVPAWQRHASEKRTRQTADDLRAFGALFQAYAHQRGDWPPGDVAPGESPPGLAETLEPTRWRAPTPLGGRYQWAREALHRGERFQAVIAIVAPAGERVRTDPEELLAVDRQLDDGNLATGSFRAGFRNTPLYVLEH